MAQSNLILLTVDYAGTERIGGVSMGLKISNIAAPIRVIAGQMTVPYTRSRATTYNQNETRDVVNYIVQESFSDIIAAGENLTLLTVNKYGINPQLAPSLSTAEQMIFYVDRIAGDIVPVGSGAGFYYHEFGSNYPVYYEVQESVVTIIGSVPVGTINGSVSPFFIPYCDSPNNLADGFLYHDEITNSTRVSSGSNIGSQNMAGTTIDFGNSGDSFNVYTDTAAVGAESAIEMGPTSLYLFTNAVGPTSGVYINPANITIDNPVQINITSPLISILDGSSIDTGSGSSTVNLFNVNATTINVGHSGASMNVAASMLDAVAYSVGGTPGVSGVFVAVGGETITVVNGIITSIV